MVSKVKLFSTKHSLRNQIEEEINFLFKDTSQEFYKPFGINYKGLQLMDVAHCNIAMYFPECTEFIQNALKSGGEK